MMKFLRCIGRHSRLLMYLGLKCFWACLIGLTNQAKYLILVRIVLFLGGWMAAYWCWDAQGNVGMALQATRTAEGDIILRKIKSFTDSHMSFHIMDFPPSYVSFTFKLFHFQVLVKCLARGVKSTCESIIISFLCPETILVHWKGSP